MTYESDFIQNYADKSGAKGRWRWGGWRCGWWKDDKSWERMLFVCFQICVEIYVSFDMCWKNIYVIWSPMCRGLTCRESSGGFKTGTTVKFPGSFARDFEDWEGKASEAQNGPDRVSRISLWRTFEDVATHQILGLQGARDSSKPMRCCTKVLAAGTDDSPWECDFMFNFHEV